MKTDEAFEKMINTTGIYKKIKISCVYQQILKKRFKKKTNSISLEKKYRLLITAGYSIKSELKWSKK